MKINVLKLYEYSIYLIVFLYLGFINFLKDLNSISISISVVLTFILFNIYLAQKNKIQVSKFVSFFVFSFVSVFVIQLYRLTKFSLSGYTITDALIHNRYNILVLLTFPIIEILAYKPTRCRFLNNIYYFGISILIFRLIAWIMYNKIHLNVAPGYFEVMGFSWARNGLSRLSGTFLDNYVWVLALFKIVKNKSFLNKLLNIFVMVLCFSYALIVYDSRSQQIAYIISLVLFIFIMSTSIQNKIWDIIGSIIIIPIILKEHYLDKLINTFSISNADYGSSTQIRMFTLNTYQSLWLERGIWWGYGISNDGNYFSILDVNMINQSDLGILSMLFKYGIIGFLIFISPVIVGMYTGLKKNT